MRDWLWLDIETTDAQRHALEKTQRQPALIYAHTVVFDSERRWDVGDFVRTSLLHQFSDGFHFKTLNSAYLLLGPGSQACQRRHHRMPDLSHGVAGCGFIYCQICTSNLSPSSRQPWMLML